MRKMSRFTTLTAITLSAALIGCSESDAEPDAGADGDGATPTGEVDPSLFLSAGLVSDVEEVDCELSDGTMTECYEITVRSEPSDHDMGPWCPTHIDDGDEAGGIWPESGVAEAVDGAFVENLATFYDDPNWQMFNADDGTINYTETLEECELAARPDVDPSLQNHCVQCDPDDLGAFEFTYTIPKTPVLLDTPQNVGGNMGVAFNGVEFANSAPTAAILGAYTLAPFDDCGGHVNPNAGYHYHAVTSDCLTTVDQDDGHAPMIGYAMDGFGMYYMNNEDGDEPDDLDDCRGHSDDERGYHYHVSGAGENMILGCWAGATVGGGGGMGGGGMGGGGMGSPPG